MKNWLLTTRVKKPEDYKGLQVCADEGLHQQMLAEFQQHVPAGSSVLDLGAGTGAFALRLHDHGYRVVGVDIEGRQWGAAAVPLARVDLNGPVSRCFASAFDAVCCQEVVEHVENPWHLLREIRDLLKPGGIAILSTPNVTSFLSRLAFLRTGELQSFGREGFGRGHINPIPAWEMSHIVECVGLDLVEVVPGGYLPVMDFSSFRPKRLLVNVLRLGAFLVARGHARGWNLIYVLRRPLAAATAGAAAGEHPESLSAHAALADMP